MQAIIPASGKGERMRPLTDDTPKPLIPINGKPMMEYTINLLVSHGFNEIGISVFYLGEKIKNYFGNGSRYGAKVTYVTEKELTGTAGAVKVLIKKMKPTESFLVIAPDILNNFDLTAIYKFHQKKGGLVTVGCYQRPTEAILGKSGIVVFDHKNLVTNFIERPQTPEAVISNWVNSSIYIFSPEILDYIPDEINGSKIIDFPKNIFPRLLAENRQMFAYPINNTKFYQLGLDSPDRISRAENDIENGDFRSIKNP